MSNCQLHPDDFWRAAAEAVNGRQATVVPIFEVTFKPFPEGSSQTKFLLYNPLSGAENVVEHELLERLADSASDREGALRRNRHWFDCPNEKFERVIADIASIEDTRQRIERVEVWRAC